MPARLVFCLLSRRIYGSRALAVNMSGEYSRTGCIYLILGVFCRNAKELWDT